jgi:CRISPR-associated protein Csm1
MSVQIFLQGNLVGIDDFVSAEVSSGEVREAVVVGRCRWIALLSEVLPRAVLAELGLAKILLGWSGGGGFFLVLPQESLGAAEEILSAADAEVRRMSGGMVRLAWGWTENLGDWTIVRKRLNESVFRAQHTDSTVGSESFFAPGGMDAVEDTAYFRQLAARLREAKAAGWDREHPAAIAVDAGKYQWLLGAGDDGIGVMRHAAPKPEGAEAATGAEMASLSQGRQRWGVLRADVDGLAARIRRVQSVEDYVALSMMYQQFFAGELEILCSMPEYWQRVTVLYSGGGDFAAYGAWDALLALGREIQRLFQRFVETNLQELAGPEGKTITMALELGAGDDSLAAVLRRSSESLEIAKSTDRDCLRLFGATVEWRQMQHTGQVKDILLRMVGEFGCTPQIFDELAGFYRDKPVTSGRPDRPWRYHRRLGVMLGEHKDRELQRLQKALISDMVGKSPTQVKLRPVGRAAVEWARHLSHHNEQG